MEELHAFCGCIGTYRQTAGACTGPLRELSPDRSDAGQAGAAVIPTMRFAQSPAKTWEQTLAEMLLDACVSGNPTAGCMVVEQGTPQPCAQPASMLHVAATSNSPEVVRLLCAAHVSTAVQDANGRTPLAVALQHGHQQCAITLMLEGAPGVFDTLQDSLSKWREALLALLGACPNTPPESYVQVGQRLLAMQSETEEIRRVLFRSIMHRDIGGIRLLLQARIDPNHQDPKSQRSALEVAEAMLESDLAATLRSFGAIEHRNPHFEEWAFQVAAACGDHRCVTHWASHAALDWRDPLTGFITALMYAAAEGHRDIVWTLLDSRACAALYDAQGCTAADLARRRGHSALADALEVISQSHFEELVLDFTRTEGSERAVHAVEEYRRPPVGGTGQNKTALTACRKPAMKWKEETQAHQTHLHQPVEEPST